MNYVDTVKLATTTVDGYGDKTATVLADIGAVFIRRSGIVHDGNLDAVQSDAAVYLDPTNDAVAAKLNSLEGLYIVANDEWYRISHVTIAQRKLLNNAIDNVYCLLQKEAGVAYATYVS